ncbi:MAG: FAD-dependent oxidoreductase [Planctomycetota bacterium]|nr:FAD-dependent oxidoreductase [Planctomycetota bacterium]
MKRRAFLKSSAFAGLSTGLSGVAAAAASETNSSDPSKKTFRLVRDIPVEEGYDVVVAGGGPAGCGAAIAAARLGAKVLLVEEMGWLGGVATSGLIPFAPPLSNHKEVFVGGIYREIFAELERRGFIQPGVGVLNEQAFRKWIGYQPEGLKLVLDDLAARAGVEVRFQTRLLDVDADRGGKTVRGVVLGNIEGYRMVRAKAFVDATGDAVLADLCDVKCREAGRDTKGIMPPTLASFFSGIDFTRFRHSGQSEGLKRALADGHFTQPDPHLPGLLRISESVACLNGGHLFGLNALRCKDLSDGAVLGRKIAQEYLEFYRKYVPGCEKVELVSTAAKIGIRESRRIVGEYELTIADYMAWRQFPDQIAVFNYPIDIHAYDLSQKERKRFEGEYLDKRDMRGKTFGLPYGILVPRGWTNLWTAGRCVASDVKVHGAIRIQACCSMMGQAAGTAAMQSIRTAKPAAKLDTQQLVTTLRKAGAFLPQKETAREMTRAS